MARKEGVKRLSIAAAAITPIGVFFAIIMTVEPTGVYVLRIAVFSLFCGFFAWGLVRLVAWVIEGFFRQASGKNP